MSLCRIFTSNVYRFSVKDVFCSTIVPSRNTYIVKRKIPVPLSRANAKYPRVLKAKHFIYETVEDTDLTESPDIHIVLTTFVDGIGDVGDVISVMPEYGRNNLLLPRKAVYASPENIEKYGNIKKTRPERAKFSSIHAGMTFRCLSKSTIPVFMNHEVSWTLDKIHVQVALRNQGFFVPQDSIEIPHLIEGPDSDKEEKDFAIYITINNTERVPVRCRLFHIRPGFETAKLTEEFYLEKKEPILADQKQLLDEMPKPEIFDDPSQSVSLVEKYRIQYIK